MVAWVLPVALLAVTPPVSPRPVGTGVGASLTVGPALWLTGGPGANLSAFLGVRVPSTSRHRFALGLGTGALVTSGQQFLGRLTLGVTGLGQDGLYHEAGVGLLVARVQGSGRTEPGWTLAGGVGYAPPRARGFVFGARPSFGSYGYISRCDVPSGKGDLPELDDPCSAINWYSGPTLAMTIEVFLGFVFL